MAQGRQCLAEAPHRQFVEKKLSFVQLRSQCRVKKPPLFIGQEVWALLAFLANATFSRPDRFTADEVGLYPSPHIPWHDVLVLKCWHLVLCVPQILPSPGLCRLSDLMRKFIFLCCETLLLSWGSHCPLAYQPYLGGELRKCGPVAGGGRG